LFLAGRLSHRWITVFCRGVPLAAAVLLCACAKPYVQPTPGTQGAPRLTRSYAVMEDGYQLPLSRWESAGNPNPHAVLLALHGLNDYRRAFDNLGRYLARRDISVVAYDQRGFGATSGRGLWHGSQRLSADLATMTALLRQEYPGIPLYLLGESMGGAVALASLGSASLDVAGTILVAPAVWSRDSMPVYQRAALWIAAHTLPARRLTGEGLDLKPSDNSDMLRALGRDELVIKATRVDVLYGVSNLMDTALLAARDVRGNVLLLYGQHDDIIPSRPTCQLLEQLSDAATTELTAIVYERGYHMLTRDLQADVVLEDIADWIDASQAPQLTGRDLRLYCSRSGGGT
jgi:alpha-beta hydrolase superfamily lysophospholipase